MNSTTTLEVQQRGRERYADTWALQRELVAQRRVGSIPDQLILVEHEAVITLGRSGNMGNLLITRERLAALGIDYFEIERGGDITYHGPGQLVAYPIIALRERGLSLRDYMRGLEDVLIAVAADFGIAAERIAGRTGVWCGAGKLAAIGVAVTGGVTYHGIALNVTTDLTHFAHIVPCGIGDAEVASLASVNGNINGAPATLDAARDSFTAQFMRVFGYALATTA